MSATTQRPILGDSAARVLLHRIHAATLASSPLDAVHRLLIEAGFTWPDEETLEAIADLAAHGIAPVDELDAYRPARPTPPEVDMRLSFSDECDGDAQQMIFSPLGSGWHVDLNGEEVQVISSDPDGLLACPVGSDGFLDESRLFQWEAIESLHVH
jgi:hypothetical protein